MPNCTVVHTKSEFQDLAHYCAYVFILDLFSSFATVPVKGTAALHARKTHVLHAHYTHITRSVHTPYTQIHENACNCTRVITRSRHDIACKITHSCSTQTQLMRVMRTKY